MVIGCRLTLCHCCEARTSTGIREALCAGSRILAGGVNGEGEGRKSVTRGRWFVFVQQQWAEQRAELPGLRQVWAGLGMSAAELQVVPGSLL